MDKCIEELVAMIPVSKGIRAFKEDKFIFYDNRGNYRGIYEENTGIIKIWNFNEFGKQKNGYIFTVECVILHEVCHAIWNELMHRSMKDYIREIHKKLRNIEKKEGGYIFNYKDARDSPEEFFCDQMPRIIFKHKIGSKKIHPRSKLVRMEMVELAGIIGIDITHYKDDIEKTRENV